MLKASAFAATLELPTATAATDSIFGTYSKLSQENQMLTEAEIDLKFLTEEFVNEHQKELEDKKNEESALQDLQIATAEKIKEISESPNKDQNLLNELNLKISELQERIAALVPEIAELENSYEQTEHLNNLEIEQKNQEISKIKANIEKTREVAKNQFLTILKRAGIIIALIILSFLFGKIAKRAIRKNSHKLSSERREILIKIVNIFVISVIVLVVIAIVFSQFVMLLPFLALLGTGLAFAVRDVILSFLAWFFIGTQGRFKQNDLIEIGDARGRVLDINLIHTTLKETGERGSTGRIITFPNKKIFEETVRNFSAMYQFTWVILDFYLTRESNIQKAKNLMLETIQELTVEDLEEVQKNLPSLTNKFNFTDEEAKSHVYVELTEKGIAVKIKFLCRLSQRHILRSKISETIIEKISREEDIAFKFLMM
ncbi:mechanosensitive ion channel [Patescibacteria group bacterium]|nr:mechanosensitive ion channel [Patescibacteria group bacterium]